MARSMLTRQQPRLARPQLLATAYPEAEHRDAEMVFSASLSPDQIDSL